MVDLAVLVLVFTQAILLFWSVCRIISRHQRSTSSTPRLLPQVKMETTPVEVSWKLVSHQNESLTLQATVSNSVEVITYRSFWGVNIESFHHVLQSPWGWFFEAFTKGNLFGSNSYDILDEKLSMVPKSSTMLDIKVPELNLGKAPRSKYPLVLVSMSNVTQSAFSIIVVHLEDKAFMNLNTHILASFVKLSDNRVSRIEHIYTNASESEEKDNCVICLSKPATRVSLPCRHASTCSACFKRLPKGQCPMCRSKITSFFVLSQEEPADEEPEEPTIKPNWRQRLARLEERFALATGLADNE